MKSWHDEILAWHSAFVTNGPTESVNNLIKRVKRIAAGMTNFANFRIRALLVAGHPDWSRLATVVPVTPTYGVGPTSSLSSLHKNTHRINDLSRGDPAFSYLLMGAIAMYQVN